MNRELLPIGMLVLIFAIAFYVDPLVKTDPNGLLIGNLGLMGTANGMVGKVAGIYLVPIISAIIYFGLLVIPRIEVYQKNLEDFADQFWGFKVVLVFAMGVIYVATLIPNLGVVRNFDPVQIVVPAIALLFFYVGYMLNFTKRNYFIGVNTPWTLADEKVWEKTNHLAGKLFWICGGLALISLATPRDVWVWVLLLPVVVVAIVASLYSLFEYRKTKHAHYAAARARAGRKKAKRRK